MICATCGTTNEVGRKFCKECGSALAAICANCGAANSPDAKFCGECGTGLQAGATASGGREPHQPRRQRRGAAASAPSAAPHAERRLVSVLFADLVGFTTLSEGRDPEDTRELLSSYFDLARDVIVRHGGTVEKFIGDAVMAVWGAPIAQEDDAERAVRAALELVDNVKSLGPEIQARAGVLTGEAAVNLGAIGEGMVAGDLVNTASRLQSVAAPGTVLVGETTERAANQGIQFEPVGEQALKGKTVPVPAYRALRIVAEVGGRNRTEGLEAPVRRPRRRVPAAQGPVPHHVSRQAPASRLGDRPGGDRQEPLCLRVQQLRRRHHRQHVLALRSLPVVRRGRHVLGAGRDDPPSRGAAGGRRRSHDAHQGRGDGSPMGGRRIAAGWVETALLAVLGLGEPPAGGRDELFAACRTFFERIAEQGTTVLLFEDLQWADSGLLDFIDHLLDWTKSLPIFVVTLSRPELLERRPDWGAGRRNFVSLALEPLPETAMNELLDGLVPGLPANVRQQIVSRADGIPLYAVETVRMLVADGQAANAD